jgi:hypothetical protein
MTARPWAAVSTVPSVSRIWWAVRVRQQAMIRLSSAGAM